MKAKIITIGDELLIGQVVDTNSSWLAAELTKIGFNVSSILSISDTSDDIAKAITESEKENELTILTGGLGPTKDDITKTTLCKIFNSQLKFNEVVYADVEAFLAQRGVEMNHLNKDQALFPADAILLRNRHGTAPGIWLERNNRVIISLPGVPWEMKGIFKHEIVSRLEDFFNLPENYYQTIMISGIGESTLAIKLENWENQLPKYVKVAYLPSPGLIRLRLGITNKPATESHNKLETEIKKLYKIIPKNIVSDTEVSLQEIIGKLLNNSNKTIATAESCSGGNIAKMITSVPGCSQYFKGSIIAYSNEIKTKLLNVNKQIIQEYGAVSKQVVEAMAIGACKKLNTDYAIATSGIAGPEGGTLNKPVGYIWIAISDSNNTISKVFQFGKEREVNIKRTSIAALNMLREYIIYNS